MKLLVKITMILLFMGQAQAFSATCEATNGWLVETSPLQIGKPRVSANAMISVYDDSGKLVVGFSAYTEFTGTEPEPGQQDDYEIQSVLQDKIGLNAFYWKTPYACPRCAPDMNHLPSQIKIVSDSGDFHLVCKL